MGQETNAFTSDFASKLSRLPKLKRASFTTSSLSLHSENVSTVVGSAVLMKSLYL